MPDLQDAATDDRLQRALADLDNYRKRFDRELALRGDLERDRILRDLLPIVDNLERSLSFTTEEAGPWYVGVEAVHRQLLDVLQRYGVEPTNDEGRGFDPEWHEVIATAPSGLDPGTIVDVAQRGYKIGDKPLRHAQVVVAKPKPE